MLESSRTILALRSVPQSYLAGYLGRQNLLSRFRFALSGSGTTVAGPVPDSFSCILHERSAKSHGIFFVLLFTIVLLTL